MNLLEPDFLVDEHGRIQAGPVLLDGGHIVALGAEAEHAARVAGDDVTHVNLAGRMLMPGFVNAHSHAFQRALRGRVETRGIGQRDDFWSWREAMYHAANTLSIDDVEALAAWAFLDMARAGFTTVGEFHYLHHNVQGARVGIELSRALARAAARVGLRLVLLETAYERAGPGKPLLDAQRRFAFAHVDEFIEHTRTARRELTTSEGAGVTVAAAVHSVRACSRGWIEAVARMARDDGVVLHVHACEQRAEGAACMNEHGKSPIAFLDACGALTSSTTIVHATHAPAEDMERIGKRGARVAVCPSTERNLGDGLVNLSDLVDANVDVCIGTDQHARIDVVDELRSLEDHERLRTERRCILVPEGGRLAHRLMPAGTVAGARALGVDVGRLAAGAVADLVAVRVPLEGRADDAVVGLDAWLVGGSSHDVTDVWIAGRHVIRAGAHEAARDIERAAVDVLRSL